MKSDKAVDGAPRRKSDAEEKRNRLWISPALSGLMNPSREFSRSDNTDEEYKRATFEGMITLEPDRGEKVIEMRPKASRYRKTLRKAS